MGHFGLCLLDALHCLWSWLALEELDLEFDVIEPIVSVDTEKMFAYQKMSHSKTYVNVAHFQTFTLNQYRAYCSFRTRFNVTTQEC